MRSSKDGPIFVCQGFYKVATLHGDLRGFHIRRSDHALVAKLRRSWSDENVRLLLRAR